MMQVLKKYKQTELGLIPVDWDVKTINEAFDICNNLRLPISEDIRKKMQGEYPYYGPTKIQDYLNEYRVDGEYALIGEDGDHFLKWNEIPMTQITSGKFNVNNHAHLVKGKKNISTTKWFYYFFKNRDITNHLTRQGAGRYKLSKSTLVKIPCAIPPTIDEQTTITTALSDTDVLISNLKKLIAKKRSIFQGAMQKLLQPKEGWQVEKIGDISKVGRGRVISHKEIDFAIKHKYPVYSSQTTNNGIMGYIDTYDFDGEYVTWTTDGENAGTVFYRNGKFNCTNVCGTIKLIKDNAIFISLLLGATTSKYVSRNLANPKLMNDPMKRIEISLPPIEEQNLIATVLSDMDAEITTLENKLEKYRNIKSGMMQNLLIGKIRLV